MNAKHPSAILVVFGLVILLAALIVQHVRVAYIYDRDVGSFWSLADKTSTIEKKAEYINRYVSALEKSGAMHGHNAVVFQTPDNDLEQNMIALRSLRDRLNQIRTMDIQSFAYQQAIQQITAQEQGEAHGLTDTLYGGWLLHNGYWYLWSWIGGGSIVGLILATIVTIVTGIQPRRAQLRALRR